MTDANNSNNNCSGGNGSACAGASTGTNNGGWFTVVPSGVTITGGTITINSNGQITFDDIDLAVPVEEKKEITDGCTCKKCGEFYPYADPPEPDKFNCYSCRLAW
jgi:hypothetical protein